MQEDVVPIPFLELTAEFKSLEAEWIESIGATGAAGSFILGPNVQAFEREFADYVGVKHAIGVANGTDALILSLRALGIGPGDEVVTTPFTFFASSEGLIRSARRLYSPTSSATVSVSVPRVSNPASRPGPRPSCRCISSGTPATWTRSCRLQESVSCT